MGGEGETAGGAGWYSLFKLQRRNDYYAAWANRLLEKVINSGLVAASGCKLVAKGGAAPVAMAEAPWLWARSYCLAD